MTTVNQARNIGLFSNRGHDAFNGRIAYLIDSLGNIIFVIIGLHILAYVSLTMRNLFCG